MTFFIDWALWQQMSISLGVAICIVIFAGWISRERRNRRVRNHERQDAERLANETEKIRTSRVKESGDGKNIPFGIRALQSGIEIDGIWVSKTGTPVPDSVRQARLERTSGTSMDSNSYPAHSNERSSRISESQDELSASYIRRSQSPDDCTSEVIAVPAPAYLKDTGETVRSSCPEIDEKKAAISWHTRAWSIQDHSAFKPKRSSQLRLGSQEDSQYHKESLSQLEGKAIKASTTLANRQRGSVSPSSPKSLSESVAADNEFSSGSYDSEGTPYEKRSIAGTKLQAPFNFSRGESHGEARGYVSNRLQGSLEIITPATSNYRIPSYDSADEAEETSEDYQNENRHHSAKIATGMTSTSYELLPYHSSEDSDRRGKSHETHNHQESAYTIKAEPMGDYFASLGAPDPFATPEMLPVQTSRNFDMASRPGTHDSDSSKDARWPLLPSRYVGASPFRPGELHANKSVRKVNSGFEVLPAGTFGHPALSMSTEKDGVSDAIASPEDESKKTRKKLQKRDTSSRICPPQTGFS